MVFHGTIADVANNVFQLAEYMWLSCLCLAWFGWHHSAHAHTQLCLGLPPPLPHMTHSSNSSITNLFLYEKSDFRAKKYA
jgi:hypothetical protein